MYMVQGCWFAQPRVAVLHRWISTDLDSKRILASVFQCMIPAYPSSYDLAMSYPLCHFAGDVLAYAVACLISKSSGFRLIEFS